MRQRIPRRWRDELYHLRTLGWRDYASNKGRRFIRGEPELVANAPFDIGARVPIVLDESTLKAVRSHWVQAGQEMRELAAFKKVARGRSCFVDIGAAQGIYAAAFCALTGGRAFAFEPSPSMFDELEALIDLNPGFSITPCKTALGAATGHQRVQSFGAQFRGVNSAAADAQTMNVETLDSFAERNGLAPELVKIDVEGMELAVLRGGAKTFRRSVEVIMLEVHPKMLLGGESVSDLQALLDDAGFKLLTLDLAPLTDLAGYLSSRGRALRPAVNIVCQKAAD